MGCYLSKVQFPNCGKLYWFRSEQCPQIGSECKAWARGRKTLGKIAKTYYAPNERVVLGIAHIPLPRIAPLISYATQYHSDSVSIPIGHVHVSPQFYEHFPQPEKIMKKYRQIVFEGVDLPLVIERSTSLLKDGFAAYLIYTMLRRDQVPVVYVTSVEK